ncbi:hypothetical protein PAAG_07561 [Paracoccidioides lutzii Pb01]|uniref:Uncharacterized protein n=1 Tax=Paracoccidioides lutzii (strain ATCC MYA-826 / Pb01) TaxID=502779 RepID=C1HAA7_PARBA|nr:hypothetical protein PAAG_07561 [Paracoccidioides lutzii Pb01]EEH37280.2 hypothetical protein PAAG_07561 [Paracoccidioides lutzii Pb01]
MFILLSLQIDAFHSNMQAGTPTLTPSNTSVDDVKFNQIFRADSAQESLGHLALSAVPVG